MNNECRKLNLVLKKERGTLILDCESQRYCNENNCAVIVGWWHPIQNLIFFKYLTHPSKLYFISNRIRTEAVLKKHGFHPLSCNYESDIFYLSDEDKFRLNLSLVERDSYLIFPTKLNEYYFVES